MMQQVAFISARLGAAGAARLVISLVQALLLFLLFQAVQRQIWPGTQTMPTAMLLVPLLLAPQILMQGLGHVRVRTLVVWTLAVAICGAGFAAYDVFTQAFPMDMGKDTYPYKVIVCMIPALLIAQTLLIAAARDGRPIAEYPTYFETACTHIVQVLAAGAFTGALWILLALAAALFRILGITFVDQLLEKPWFAVPVTSMAVAAAIHITDVRSDLIRNIKVLALTLLSRLLPVVAIIAAAFLATLLFTGLQPLWATKTAATLLLAMSAALAIFINAAYQDGTVESSGLRTVARLGAVLPAPLVAIAAYAVFLRVQQYGWTAERALATTAVGFAAWVALGYFASAVIPGRFNVIFRATNIVAAFAGVVLIGLLLSPVFDPVRIGVVSQVARLEEGRVAPEAFDFKSLRFDGGHFGKAALERLQAADSRTPEAREPARQALALERNGEDVPPNAAQLAANIRVGTPGGTLPADFVTQDWKARSADFGLLPECLRQRLEACEAFLLDLNADGLDEVVLINVEPSALGPAVFQRSIDGSWGAVGHLSRRLGCDDMLAKLRAGEVALVPSQWMDVEIDGLRLDLRDSLLRTEQACPGQ